MKRFIFYTMFVFICLVSVQAKDTNKNTSVMWGVGFSLHDGPEFAIPIVFGLRSLTPEHRFNVSGQIKYNVLAQLYEIGEEYPFSDYFSGRIGGQVIIHENLKPIALEDQIGFEMIDNDTARTTYIKNHVMVADQLNLNIGYVNHGAMNRYNNSKYNYNYLSFGLGYGSLRLDTLSYLWNLNASFLIGLTETGMFKENGILIEWITPFSNWTMGSAFFEMAIEFMYVKDVMTSYYDGDGDLIDQTPEDKFYFGMIFRGVR